MRDDLAARIREFFSRMKEKYGVGEIRREGQADKSAEIAPLQLLREGEKDSDAIRILEGNGAE